MIDDRLRAHRLFLTDVLRKQADFSQTDQNKGIPAPPLQKPADPEAPRIALPGPKEWPSDLGSMQLIEAIARRKSRRNFSGAELSLEELSFLLWATQGIRQMLGRGTALRNVPSAGARHSFESYVFIRDVERISPALYRYLPMEHEIILVHEIADMERSLSRAAYGQQFVGNAAATFVWACIPYRMEWRYGLTAHRVILMDVGHVCQNLYLACESIDAGTCAVAAYDQKEMDKLIGLDGEEEFAIYVAPVGKRLSSPS